MLVTSQRPKTYLIVKLEDILLTSLSQMKLNVILKVKRRPVRILQ